MEHRNDSRPSVCFQFQVEKILDVSADGNYQVQWAPAWVSKFHLVGCEHLIQDFLQKEAEMVDIDTELNHFGDTNTNIEMNSSRHHSPELAGQLQGTMLKSEMQGECDGFDSGNCTDHQIANCAPHQQLIFDAVKVEPEHLENLTTISDTGTDLELPEDETICQTSVETSNSLLGGEEKNTALEAHLRFSVDQLPNSVCTSSMDNRFGSLYDEYHLPQAASKDDLSTDMEMQKQKQCSSPVDYPRKSSTAISMSKKRHSCSECNKTFRQRCDVVRHMRTHSGERPFKCNECHKLFSQKHNLRTHMQIHSGDKPFTCHICAKSFTQSNSLKRHHQLIHRET